MEEKNKVSGEDFRFPLLYGIAYILVVLIMMRGWVNPSQLTSGQVIGAGFLGLCLPFFFYRPVDFSFAWSFDSLLGYLEKKDKMEEFIIRTELSMLVKIFHQDKIFLGFLLAYRLFMFFITLTMLYSIGYFLFGLIFG